MGRVIKVSDETYRKLNDFAGKLRSQTGRPVSMNEAILMLLKKSAPHNVIKEILKQRKEIISCYSIKTREETTIGVLLERKPDDSFYAEKLAREIEERTNARICVIVLNDLSFTSLYHFIIKSKLLVSNNEIKRIRFEALVTEMYLDMKPLIEEYNKKRMERLYDR